MRIFPMRLKWWWVGWLLLIGGIYVWHPFESAIIAEAPPFLAWGFSVDGFPITEKKLADLEKETRIAADVIQFYLQWPRPSEHFEPLTPSLNAIANNGSVPCMTWEPMTVLNNKEEAIPYNDILEGVYDEYLTQVAKEIQEWNHPLIIRLAHEMNLQRYHWGTSQNHFGEQSPEIYIRLFQYVVNFFKERNVKNILWAFCPNADSVPDKPWNKPASYYPGNESVDILGMDGYNWMMTPEIAKARGENWTKPWLSFEQIFINLYKELKTIAPNKPIFVFETASVSRNGQKKSEWIQAAIQTAKKWKLAGIIWFQANKEEDWRIQQNDDYSYVPFIRTQPSSLNDWLNERLEEKAK